MVIFACGVFTGAFVTHTQPVPVAVVSNPQPQLETTNKAPLPNFAQLQPQRPEFLRRLDTQLDLTPEQHDHIANIINASRDRTAPLWEKIAPQMSDELKRVREEIRKALTPEQRKKWMELNKRGRAAASDNGKSNQPIEVPESGTSGGPQ